MGISTIQELTKKISQKQNGTNLTRLEIETVEIDPKQDLMSKWNNFSLYSLDSKKSIFKNANFKNEKEEIYTKSFYKYCKNFEKAKDMGIGILMYGNAGTGKTFLTDCIYNELKASNVIYKTTLSYYLQSIKDSFNSKSEDWIINMLKEVDLIILDDVGNERLTEWSMEHLYNLFNFIYTNKKPLIINTNLSLFELEEFLTIKKSNKLTDRISELCKIFHFDWESRRSELNKEIFKELF